jgi:iron-sulfur cluster assembly 1
MTPLVILTASAKTQIINTLDQHPNQWLKLGVNNRGCSGHSYTFELIPAHSQKKFDELISVGSHVIVIDASSVLRLIGSTLDWQTDRFGSKFIWHNPSVKNTCGCGESVGF